MSVYRIAPLHQEPLPGPEVYTWDPWQHFKCKHKHPGILFGPASFLETFEFPWQLLERVACVVVAAAAMWTRPSRSHRHHWLRKRSPS